MTSERKPRSRLWLAVLTLVAVFALGVVAGLGVAYAFRPPPPPDFLTRDSDAVLSPFDRFGLDAKQKAQARVIVERHAAAMEEALRVA
ncbi:MAG: hypothetical protein ACOYOB_21025, partial [Myxococcota bacterium]